MQFIIRNYAKHNTNIKTNFSQYDVLIFLTGFITIVHTLLFIPQFVNLAILVVLFIWWLALRIVNDNFILNNSFIQYLLWYGLFTILVVLSYFYTINVINASYAIIRVVFGFLLGILVSDLVKTELDFYMLASGIIYGGLFAGVGVFILENRYIGLTRLGPSSVGSSPALAAIMLVSFSCSIWHIMQYEKGRWLHLIYSVIFYAMIILSGSRRSMLLAPFILLLLILMNNKIKIGKKTIVFIMILCTGIFFVIYSLSNETLYKLIGSRLESMFISFHVRSDFLIDDSMRLRQIMKDFAMDLFSQRPIWGYGAHGFAYMFNQSFGLLLYSHNGFVEILSCYGIVGFVLFYRIFLNIFYKGIKQFFHGSLHSQMLFVYATVSFISEIYTMAFLAPYVIVMLTAYLSIDN